MRYVHASRPETKTPKKPFKPRVPTPVENAGMAKDIVPQLFRKMTPLLLTTTGSVDKRDSNISLGLYGASVSIIGRESGRGGNKWNINVK